MATITVNPLVLKDVILELGDSDFAKHIDQATFTPSSSSITWTGLGGNTHTDVATATWVLSLNYAQDWETVGSLSAYLFANEGLTVDATFRPRSGTGPSFAAEVVITPGAIGGSVNAYATASVTLGVNGKPVLVPGV